MKTKTLLLVLGAIMMFAAVAPISLSAAYPRVPYALVWITKSSTDANLYMLTYENFGLKNIAKIEITLLSEVTIASENTPRLNTYISASNSYAGWTTVLVSDQQLYWQTSTRAKDRMSMNFYMYNTPCNLQIAIYDKDSNLLITALKTVA